MNLLSLRPECAWKFSRWCTKCCIVARNSYARRIHKTWIETSWSHFVNHLHPALIPNRLQSIKHRLCWSNRCSRLKFKLLMLSFQELIMRRKLLISRINRQPMKPVNYRKRLHFNAPHEVCVQVPLPRYMYNYVCYALTTKCLRDVS